jgi:hypothetical protein
MMCVHPQPGNATTGAKEKTFEAIGINNKGATMDGPFNTMGWRFPVEAPYSHFLS